MTTESFVTVEIVLVVSHVGAVPDGKVSHFARDIESLLFQAEKEKRRRP